ncbi:MAG: nucleotidyltransferase domain-containing protein [Selenomonadaceae bacterium]|nr:nucleotidyltransferase domain-containing protein [Selenomonadaceae bacterium]
MSTRADIIDLLDNATEKSLEKILRATKEILRGDKGDKIYTIDEIRDKVIPLAKKYGVRRMWLFGSYARGDADAQSDVDFLVDSAKNLRGMFAYTGLIQDLENELGCHVDLISEGISDKNFLAEIQKDEVLLYEETA